jgi:hypothetical protein
MPEAPVDKHDLSVEWQGDVRSSRKVSPMETKSEAKRMDHAAHRNFRSHILASDAAHVFAAPQRV